MRIDLHARLSPFNLTPSRGGRNVGYEGRTSGREVGWEVQRNDGRGTGTVVGRASNGDNSHRTLWLLPFVGHGGALVESKPFNRRVMGSKPALATT